LDWNHNEERTLEAEKEVFAKLASWGTSGKGHTLNDIEQTLKNFNAIHEHEDDGYYSQSDPSKSTKIQLLQAKLQSWGATDPSLAEINLLKANEENFMGYDKSKGEENRNKYLCDKDGKPLDQKLYGGTILSECKK